MNSDRRHPYLGRRVLRTPQTEINERNLPDVISSVMPRHVANREETEYLWRYYRGAHPILGRIKDVRPEINNRVVINRAYEIVSYKSGYLMGQPIQYIATREEDVEAVARLNRFAVDDQKAAKDKKLADWFHISGSAYRLTLPNPEYVEGSSPFSTYVLDPRRTFVIYSSDYSGEPVLGATYYTDADGSLVYSVYTRDMFYKLVNPAIPAAPGTPAGIGQIVEASPHLLGEVPIVEYPHDLARLGVFEIVLDILDGIDLAESDRLNGLEQVVQSLLLFHNVDIDDEKFDRLKAEGGLCFQDVDPSAKGEVQYLINTLDQAQSQVQVDDLYQTVLTICGMPNRNGGSSTSDTGAAVILRDGFSAAETRALDAEAMFKQAERRTLKVICSICAALTDVKLTAAYVEPHFTRQNYENIWQKAQILDLLLKNENIHPLLPYVWSGITTDPQLAYKMGCEYKEKLKQEAESLKAALAAKEAEDERQADDTEQTADNRDNGLSE